MPARAALHAVRASNLQSRRSTKWAGPSAATCCGDGALRAFVLAGRPLLLFCVIAALLVSRTLACGDLIRTWEYRESMARETCPAMLMITSSPAPD
jgi:hypothetical protein